MNKNFIKFTISVIAMLTLSGCNTDFNNSLPNSLFSTSAKSENNSEMDFTKNEEKSSNLESTEDCSFEASSSDNNVDLPWL